MSSPAVVRDMDHDTRCYLAGIVDGEGCLSIARQFKHASSHNYCYSPYLKIVMTHEGVIRHIAEKTGYPYYRVAAPVGANAKDTFRVQFSNPTAILAVLEQIGPYLIVKREAAEVLAVFCRSRLANWPANNYARAYSEEEISLYHDIRSLNKRGIDLPSMTVR